jgi:diadenosine tetraphosphate (Ap4A) HIT family hydrolase/5-methylcytosine-specific restriction endonuclease McrA
MSPSRAFTELRDFMQHRMRMSHIYQPLMIKTLLEGGGSALISDIAACFLSHDQSQREYYEEITKRMPGKVLANHGLVRRDGDRFRLTSDVSALSADERDELVRMCDSAVAQYLEKRGEAVFAHRRISAGYIPGSLRYEVLRRAGGRCELCGVPAEERAVEVDHIVPRKHGGSEDISNLQALCYVCNANKGARDVTDFRAVTEGRDHREEGCAFCSLEEGRIIAENLLAIVIRDAHPVTPFHTLIIPKRHAVSYFDLYEPERRAISLLLDPVKAAIEEEDRSVSGFNIGINSGQDAGQTVPHCHVHLIPRRKGDVETPRGGVRGVIPGKASY